MTDLEFTGKTVDEAVEEGLKTLGLTREEAHIEVLEEGKKGGLFSKGVKARVKVGKKQTDGERAQAFLDGLFGILNFTATTELDETQEHTRINVITPNTYAVIGHRGEFLDALQVLAGAVANIGRDEYERVVVDCENYRSKREETLKRLAQKLADKAVRSGRKVAVEPMTPYERRIIHSALAENPDVKTVSEGKEPNRYIVVVPNNLRPGADRPDRRFDKRAGRDGRRESRPYGDRPYGDRRERPNGKGGYDRDRRREDRPRASGLPRSKRQPYFGTFLGNSNDLNKSAENKTSEKKEEE